MTNDWRPTSLSEILKLERRPVKLDPEMDYAEIGIYSYGRGIFHKQPRTGFEVGDKDLFLIKKGDFIFQITFAWEGAFGLASESEDGMYGSVRFPTFRVNEDICYPPFLLNYFKIDDGRNQLIKISPGSAGRNRVLSIKRLPEILVPLPSLHEQRRIIQRVEELATHIAKAQSLRKEAREQANKLFAHAARKIFIEREPQVPLGNILTLQRGYDLPRQNRIDGPFPIYASNGVVAYHNEFRAKGPGVITGRSGSVGSAKYVEEDYWPLNTALYVKDFKGNEPKLIYYLIQSISKELKDVSSHTAVPTLDRKKAHTKIFVHIPPLDEQRRIVAYLDSVQARLASLRELQSQTQEELDALLPSVLDRAFKGEL